MDEKGLLKLKGEIESAKSTVSELKGHQQALLKQLKEEWGCNSIEEASKKLQEMEKELTTLEADIVKNTKELETKYNIQ